MRGARTVFGLSLVLVLVLGLVAVSPQGSERAAAAGAGSLATPANGGRTIYVSTTGSDTYQKWNRLYCLTDPVRYKEPCPEPSMAAPLRTVETAVRVAKPGDVVAVRAGVYKEAVGWGIRRATAARPITLQAYPGERVEINGTLIMTSPDYWRVTGIHFTHNSAIQKGQALVLISGGNGWRFTGNEVTGSTGVANILINSTTTSGSAATLQAAAPRNYTISQNCIHDNRGRDTLGTDHNIYLMSSIYSTGGLIERNLIAGAPRGANIKAAASSSSTAASSPHNVLIRYNTLLSAASGVTVGLSAQNVSIERNIIASPLNSQKYDGAVKTYQLGAPGKNAVKDSLLSGYARPVSEDYGVSAHIFTARNDTKTRFAYTGSIAACTARSADAAIGAKYGQFAK